MQIKCRTYAAIGSAFEPDTDTQRSLKCFRELGTRRLGDREIIQPHLIPAGARSRRLY